MQNNLRTTPLKGQTTYKSVPSASSIRSGAAVYRSLEVPLQGQPTFRPQTSAEKSHPHLAAPQATKQGEALFYESASTKPSIDKEYKPLPIPLIVANAPHTALFLKSEPLSLVVTRVNTLFEHHYVDTEFNDSKFKWKCACYASHNETRFVCQLFAVPDKPNYFILDFQRRSGDAFHFQSIHRAMNNELLVDGFIVPCENEQTQPKEKISLRTFKPLALPDDFFDQVEEKQLEAKDFEPLCAMCVSQFIDVQREGLCALASQLEENKNARNCLVGFVDRLCSAMSTSRDIQVRRLSVSALGWISMDSRLTLHKGEIDVLEKLVLNEQELVETRRQAAKVLMNLIKSGSKSISEATSLIKSANIIASDARLREAIQILKAM